MNQETPEQTPEQKPFFTAFNRHFANYGTPPVWVAGTYDSDYFAYFENSLTEQWVFRYSYSEEVGFLRGGDANWKNEYRVEGETLDEAAKSLSKTLTLNEVEWIWLGACWTAATAGRKYRREKRAKASET